MKIGIAGAGAGKTTAMADTIIQFRSEIVGQSAACRIRNLLFR